MVVVFANQTIADKERAVSGTLREEGAASLPNSPDANAAGSPLKTTLFANRRSPFASSTPVAVLSRTVIRDTDCPYRNTAPFSLASFSNAVASALIPPSMAQTPFASTWAISIKVAGVWNGEEPQ